jgi:hypothetical protein
MLGGKWRIRGVQRESGMLDGSIVNRVVTTKQ